MKEDIKERIEKEISIYYLDYKFNISYIRKINRKYNGKLQNQCARITVSTCYDLLNNYTLDTIVESYNYSETEMAKRHYETINNEGLLGDFKTIRIMDRNYKNLSHIYHYIKNDNKFISLFLSYFQIIINNEN